MAKRKLSKKIKLVGILVLIAALAVAGFIIFGGDKAKKVVEKAKDKVTKKKKEEPKVQIVNEDSTRRPFAVMINNLHVARQMHSGLQDAYIIYEIIVEGGITRYMAIFEGDKDIDRIGPVRSSRHYFLDYVLENDAIYVHNGYSPQAGTDFGKLGIDRIEAEAPKTGVRENPLKLAREHTLFTSTKLLNENGVGKKRTEKKEKGTLLSYSVKPVDVASVEGAKEANKVKIPTIRPPNVVYMACETPFANVSALLIMLTPLSKPLKDTIMPHTVPSRPTIGAIIAISIRY